VVFFPHPPLCIGRFRKVSSRSYNKVNGIGVLIATQAPYYLCSVILTNVKARSSVHDSHGANIQLKAPVFGYLLFNTVGHGLGKSLVVILQATRSRGSDPFWRAVVAGAGYRWPVESQSPQCWSMEGESLESCWFDNRGEWSEEIKRGLGTWDDGRYSAFALSHAS
jgi:hypothetical protein